MLFDLASITMASLSGCTASFNNHYFVLPIVLNILHDNFLLFIFVLIISIFMLYFYSFYLYFSVFFGLRGQNCRLFCMLTYS